MMGHLDCMACRLINKGHTQYQLHVTSVERYVNCTKCPSWKGTRLEEISSLEVDSLVGSLIQLDGISVIDRNGKERKVLTMTIL